MPLQIIEASECLTTRKALKGIWGAQFIPKAFDVCVIASNLDEAYSVYGDEVGEVCADPEKGTVVRFVKFHEVKLETLTLLPAPYLISKHWQMSVNRADSRLVDMYERHYSCYRYADGRSRKQAIAPGQYIAVMTSTLDALFVWQKSKYRADKQEGVNCAVFRNEGSIKSSLLIQEAMELAWLKWGYQRLFTFVDARKIKSSNPGYCFKKAGWKSAGTTKSGLLIFEYLPATPKAA